MTTTESSTRRSLQMALCLINATGAAAAAGFAAKGMASPNYVQPELRPNPLTQFWAASSALRTWAITLPLIISLARGRATPPLLVVAGLVQLGDSALGAQQRNPAMTVAPAIMGLCHLTTARLMSD